MMYWPALWLPLRQQQTDHNLRMHAYQVAAVLNTLGLRPAPPGLDFLTRLLSAYTRRVPWESASRIARKARFGKLPTPPRWPGEFWKQVIQYGCGGTCFESNYAFFALLQALGYTGQLTINDMGEVRGCHTALLLDVDGERWLVDVGIPLFALLRVDPQQAVQTESQFHTYTVRPQGGDVYVIERDRHPRPYIYTLIDRPVAESDYCQATAADYGERGFFLDRVIINRLVNGSAWRFNSGELPWRLEEFTPEGRVDHLLGEDAVDVLAGRFEMDARILRRALEVVKGQVNTDA